ncbi:hypothetical protein [Antarcticirhabdus aurantiaca]|uniref:hypothetical protein n=1 Tax=Antarcticirhabdus aurantiaca TaxID=2606717 RepID=UPI00131A8D7F|nr:hypothetical protein [Antarcticirhabdus aurantiaca]
MISFARDVAVVSIAYCGRDWGTPREGATMDNLSSLWRDLDAKLAALALSFPKVESEREGGR